MSRSSQRIRQSQSDPNNDEGMEVDSESEEVSRTMRSMNVSQSARRDRTKSRQVDSGSREEEPPVFQRMNGSKKVQGGKGKPRTRQVDSDSNEEPQPSASETTQNRKKKNASNQSQRAHQTLSQASTSRAGETLYGEEISASQISPNTSLTEQEFDHHVANVVKYILAADQSNNPIDRSKISKDMDCHNKKFKDIFKEAQDILKDVFGYKLEDLVDEDKNDDNTQPKQAKSTNLKYILVNTVNCEDEVVKNLCDDGDEETSIHYVLLFLTLTHIFMSGDKCTEDSLKSFLKKLEIVTDNHTRHEQFGDAMDVITKVFTKEKYINYNQKEDEFSWGMRATIELKPRAVMNFVSEMYDGRNLESWPQEYERLLAKEQHQRPNGQSRFYDAQSKKLFEYCSNNISHLSYP